MTLATHYLPYTLRIMCELFACVFAWYRLTRWIIEDWVLIVLLKYGRASLPCSDLRGIK